MPVADVTKRIRYYVSNPTTGTLSVIDGFTNNIVATYTLGLGAREVVVTKDGTVYVASADNDTISVLCLNGTIKTMPIANDGIIDVDGIGGKLYVSNVNTVNIYDAASGILIGSIPGFVSINDIAITPDRTKLLVLDNNQVKVYNTSSLNLLRTFNAGTNPIYALVTEDNRRAFIANQGDSSVTVIDLVNLVQILNIPLTPGSGPTGLAIKGTTLYVANHGANNIALINTVTYEVLANTIPTVQPTRLSITPDGDTLLATNATGGLTLIDTITNAVEGTIVLPATPFDVKSGYFGSTIAPGEPIDLTDPYQLDDITESVCILARKVFAHCQARECQPDVVIQPPTGVTFNSVGPITFKNGVIRSGSLVITPLPERPNFSRVQFIIDVPVTISYNNGQTLDTVLLPIPKDIVMFMPKSRDEFNFEVIVETRTELLNTPIISGGNIVFAAGVFIVMKVAGQVQLLVPAFGYCPEPAECEEYTGTVPEDVCETFLDFTQTPFPEDFFPPQYQDVNCQM